jgi:hypothetical protein
VFLGGGRSRPLTPLTPLSRVLFLTAAALQRCWRRFTVSHLNRVSVVKLAFCKLATCLADSTVQQWRRLDVALRRGCATSTFHTVFRLCNAAPAAPRKFRKAQPPTNFFHNALTVPFDCGSRPAGHLHLRSALAPSHPLHIVTHSFIYCVHARNRWQPQPSASAAACATTTQAASRLPPHAPSPPQPRTPLQRHNTPHVRVAPLPPLLLPLPPPRSRPRVIVLSWSDGTRGSHASFVSKHKPQFRFVSKHKPHASFVSKHKPQFRTAETANIGAQAEEALYRLGCGAAALAEAGNRRKQAARDACQACVTSCAAARAVERSQP